MAYFKLGLLSQHLIGRNEGTYKMWVQMASHLTEIQTQNAPNMKHEWQSFTASPRPPNQFFSK
jgi:hypothetical protein